MAGSHPLKKYREDNALTQEALAKSLGVAPLTVWRWENGKRTPRMRDLPMISEKTGLTGPEILGFEAKEPAQ